MSRWKGASIQIFHYTNALRVFPWGLNTKLNSRGEGLQVRPNFSTAAPEVTKSRIFNPNTTTKSLYVTSFVMRHLHI